MAKHEFIKEEDVSADTSKQYNFSAECACGWQAREQTKEDLDVRKSNHLNYHKYEVNY